MAASTTAGRRGAMGRGGRAKVGRGPTRSTRQILTPRAKQGRFAKDVPRLAPARPQPLLAVRDVKASSRWYARLLAAERSSITMKSDHAHLYDRLYSHGTLVLQLHAWDEEEHPNLMDRDAAPVGHGVLVWFEVNDFDATVRRARAMKAKVVRKPHVNPAPGHREIWLRDPDGYVVVVASPDGEAP
ncbi:MAG TPA: VOC family protein [Polyangiaceae bacterium]|nr:VOC family protein [Polyangiaceae bacterium]